MMTQWRPKIEYYQGQELETTLCFLSHIGLFAAIPKLDFLKTLTKIALTEGISEIKLQETLLQSYLFLGFPRAINALAAVQKLWQTPPKEYESDLSKEVIHQRGEVLCQKIYGPNYQKLLHNMHEIHPDLKRYMLQEGYGKMLSRDLLNPIEREFGILPILVVLETKKQLHSHLLGSLYLGAKPAELFALLKHLAGPLGQDALNPAIDLLNTIVKDSNFV